MHPLRPALTCLATTAEDVVVLMRALKLVLELHERRATRCARTAATRDADEVIAEVQEIQRLLPTAAELGRVATTLMAGARSEAEPVVAACTATALDLEAQDLLGACAHTIDFFESARRSIDVMIERTALHGPAGDGRDTGLRTAVEASGVAAQLLSRLRHRNAPGARGGA